MDDISKLKIEIFDLQREQERLLFKAKETDRLKNAKIQQLLKLEDATPENPRVK